MERKQQPILIIGERRIDVLLDGIALARELRAPIAGLYRIAFLVLPLVGDRVGLRAPFPRPGNAATRSFDIPGIADRLDLPEGVKSVVLGDLFGNRRGLLRPGGRG